MKLTTEQIEKFKNIYEKHIGPVSDEYAEMYAQKILFFIKIILKN